MEIDFFAASWLAVSICAMIIIVSVMHDRSLLLKPSFLVAMFFFLQVQVGSAILSDKVVNMLADPWEFYFVIHGYSVIALMSSLVLYRRACRTSFSRMAGQVIAKRDLIPHVFYIILPALLIVLWYLSVVPISSTGLYVSIVEPELADYAREESFTTLDAPVLKYGYYVMSVVLAPMSAIMMYLLISAPLNEVRLAWRIFGVFTVLFLIILVSLYGARGPSAMLVVSVIYAAYLQRGAPFRPVRIVLMFCLVLAGPSIISMFKNADHLLWSEYGRAFLNIVDRVFIRGAIPNIWYIDYIQTNGFWGVSGISKLARLFGADLVNVANLISLEYDKYSLPYGTANAAYITQYYSFFGIFGAVLSLLGVLALDSIVHLYRFLRPALLFPVVGALIIPFANMSFSQISTVLLSKGLIIILLVGFVVSKLPAIRLVTTTESMFGSRRNYLKPTEETHAKNDMS